MKRLIVLPVLLCATASFAAPADAVRTRIAGLKELGAAFKAMNDGLRGEPQAALLQQSARQIRAAAGRMPGWFPKGSGPQPGVKTAAKPDIWTQPAKFKAAQDAFIAQAGRLQAAAGTGNAAAVRVEARKLGGTCKGCHDSFKAPDD